MDCDPKPHWLRSKGQRFAQPRPLPAACFHARPLHQALVRVPMPLLQQLLDRARCFSLPRKLICALLDLLPRAVGCSMLKQRQETSMPLAVMTAASGTEAAQGCGQSTQSRGRGQQPRPYYCSVYWICFLHSRLVCHRCLGSRDFVCNMCDLFLPSSLKEGVSVCLTSCEKHYGLVDNAALLTFEAALCSTATNTELAGFVSNAVLSVKP